MALSKDAPRDVVGCHWHGIGEYHLPAKNIDWKAGEVVGLNMSTGVAEPLVAGLYAAGVVPESAGRNLTSSTNGAERIIAQARPVALPQTTAQFAVDAAPGLPVYWDSTANACVNTDNSGANAYLGDLLRAPSPTVVHVDIRLSNSIRAATQAQVDGLGAPSMQATNATLASGTITISTGITVAANSEVAPLQIGAITGSTNFGSLRELKASRVNGAPGTGSVVIQAVGNDGALDVDAAGAIRVLIFTPQS